VCNKDCISFVASEVQQPHVTGLDVLEVGARDVNGTVRPRIEAFKPRQYIGVDILDGPGVDMICDAEDLLDNFEEGSVDLLISTELMEHVRNWRTVLSNFKRVLRPGGHLMITTRSIGFHYHGFPFDYWRYQTSDMEHLFSDFEMVTLRKDRQHKGVFVYARKPKNYEEVDLSEYRLYSVVSRRRVVEISARDQSIFNFFYSFERFRKRYLSTGWRWRRRSNLPLEKLRSDDK
jgi:predicted SAM-dependent methyltransferase